MEQYVNRTEITPHALHRNRVYQEFHQTASAGTMVEVLGLN